MAERKQDEFLCTWQIKQYIVYAEKDQFITSPEFRIEKFGFNECQLWLCANEITEIIHCTLLLEYDMDLYETDSFGIQFTLKSSNGMVLTDTEMSSEKVKEGQNIMSCELIGMDDLEKKMSSGTEFRLILCCLIQRISSEIPSLLSEVSYIGCEMETETYDYKISFMFHFTFSHNKHFISSKEISSRFLERITLNYIDESLKIKLFTNKENDSRQNFDCTIELLNELGNRVISKSDNIKYNPKFSSDVFDYFIIHKKYLEEANCYNLGVIMLNVIISPECTLNINYCKDDPTNSEILRKEESTIVSPITEKCSDKVLKVSTCSKACQTKSMITDDAKSQSGYLRNGKEARSNDDAAGKFSLQRDLRNLFIGKLHTDVELRVGSITFPVHKSLLAARSPVFAAMFAQDMTENNERVVEIHDVEVNTMKIFLEYVYTGSVNEIHTQVALSLMLVADKYQVLCLAEKCSSYLKSALCINNALYVLSVAERVNQKQLKSSVLEYIVNNSTEILSLAEWPQWMKLNSTLSSEVFLKLSKKVDALSKSTKDISTTSNVKSNIEPKSNIIETPDEKFIGKCPSSDLG